jgi:hypothetical protein
MDKIIMFIVLLVCFSCTNKEKFDKKKTIIIYTEINGRIKINPISGELKINFLDMNYTDTINISKKEKEIIMYSFERNKIIQEKGESWCLDENNLIMPPSNNTIQIFENNKIKLCDRRYRIVNFRDNIKELIENKEEFKRAIDTFHKYQRKKKALFL